MKKKAVKVVETIFLIAVFAWVFAAHFAQDPLASPIRMPAASGNNHL